MSKRQQKKFDKVYQDFTLRHLLYEPAPKPTKTTKTSISHAPEFEKNASMYPMTMAGRESPEDSSQLDLVERALGQTMPAVTRRQVVNKALARARANQEDRKEGMEEPLSFSRTAPSPIRLKDDPSTPSAFHFQSPKSQDQDLTSKPFGKPSPPSPIFREIERNHLLEVRYKDLSEKYTALQRSYKDLLARMTVNESGDYKTRYEELLAEQRRERSGMEKRVRELEIELELAKTKAISHSTPLQSGSRDDIFPTLIEEPDFRQLSSEVKDLQSRFLLAEERIRLLEQTRDQS